MATYTPPQRLAYLLRLWRAGNGGAPQWRASLEDTITHELHGFENLASLMAFIEERLSARGPGPAEWNHPAGE
jgi:hypothetical protein